MTVATAESLLEAHHRRVRALLAADADALCEVVAADMVFVGTNGAAMTRTEVLAAMAGGALVMLRMDCSDFETQLYGHVGIVRYTGDGEISDGVSTSAARTRSTCVYVHRDEGWQMVAQHQSPLA